MAGTRVTVRLDEEALEKLDRLVGRFRCLGRPQAIHQLPAQFPENGELEKRPEIAMPLGTKNRRFYQVCLDQNILTVRQGEALWKLGLAADIRTKRSQAITMESLVAQGFARWDSEEQAWCIRKRFLHPLFPALKEAQ